MARNKVFIKALSFMPNQYVRTAQLHEGEGETNIIIISVALYQGLQIIKMNNQFKYEHGLIRHIQDYII